MRYVDESLTEQIIGHAIEVHRELGPGLLESVYEEAMWFELRQADIPCQKQVDLPVRYKGVRLDCGFRLDFVVGQRVILELKAVERLLPVHGAQLLTYLKLSKLRVGLLMNFNYAVLREGLRRFVI